MLVVVGCIASLYSLHGSDQGYRRTLSAPLLHPESTKMDHIHSSLSFHHIRPSLSIRLHLSVPARWSLLASIPGPKGHMPTSPFTG
jgi:hypothetical protein